MSAGPVRSGCAGLSRLQSVAREFAYMPLRCFSCGGPAFACACVTAGLEEAECAEPAAFPRASFVWVDVGASSCS